MAATPESGSEPVAVDVLELDDVDAAYGPFRPSST